MKKIWGFFILIWCLGSLNLSYGQVRISEEIQPSKIITAESHKLYLIDFWATWCAPCISAKKYLGVVQKQFPEDLYILSLTQETPEIVRKFLIKNPSDLAIAIDYDKETFGKHQIRSLPMSILFSGEGEIVWKGHPANLSSNKIQGLLNQYTTGVKRSNFIVHKSYKKVSSIPILEDDPKGELVIEPIKNGPEILRIHSNEHEVIYEGNLVSIMAYMFEVSNGQVFLSSDLLNQNYKITVPKELQNHKNLVKRIMRKLKLRYENNSVKGEALVFRIDEPRFWNTEQIDWGQDNPKYLIDDSQIQADNVSFSEMRYRLAFLLGMPVIGDYDFDMKKHDWQIHYKYYQLMKSDLSDNFGIVVEKRSTTYPVYILQKKTP